MTATIDVATMLNRLYMKLSDEWGEHLNWETGMHSNCPTCDDYSKALFKLLRAMDNVNVE